MGNNDVKIVISAHDQSGTVFKRLESSVGSLATKLAGAFSVWEAGNLIKDSTMLAARYETLGVVMGVVGNNAGYTKAEMDGFSEALRANGIAAMESREVLTRMVQANIDLEKATTLARIAQDAAVIGNINSSEAFERLIYGIQSAQIDVLRTIGINVNFENSYKKLAAQLGKTTNELTEQEKMQARTNVVMQAGAQIAGSYEAAMGTAGKQVLSMKRYSDDLKVSMGQVFTPALALGARRLSEGMKDANAAMKDNQTVAQQWSFFLRSAVIRVEAEIIRMSMLFDKAGGSLTSFGAFLTSGQISGGNAMVENFRDFYEKFSKKFGIETEKNLLPLSGINDRFQEWNKLYAERYAENDKKLEELAKLSVALENEAAAAGKAADAQAELEERRMAAGQAAREAAAAAELAAREAKANVIKPDKVKTKVFLSESEYGRRLELEKKMLDELSMAAMPRHQQAVEALTRQYGDWQRQVEDLAGAGRLTMEEAQTMVDGLSANMQAEYDELTAGQIDFAASSQTIWEQAQRNMVDYSQDAFFNIMKGEYDSLGEQFEDMVLRMIANWQAAQLQMALWGNDAGAGGGVGNGLIAAGVNAVVKGYTQNAGIDAARTDYFNFHSGGVVGRDGSPGQAPSSLWRNAPRLHSGLLPDEFPAILQRGEAVIPRNAVGGIGGGNVTINVYNQDGKKKDVEDTKINFDVRGLVVDVFLRDMTENGPISQSLSGGL